MITMPLLHALRTGNLMVDMILGTLLCMLVPIVMDWVVRHGQETLQCLTRYFPRQKYVEHLIVSQRMIGPFHAPGWMDMDPNHFLHKAILLYMQHQSRQREGYYCEKERKSKAKSHSDISHQAFEKKGTQNAWKYMDMDDRLLKWRPSQKLMSVNVRLVAESTQNPAPLRSFKMVQLPSNGQNLELEPQLFLHIKEIVQDTIGKSDRVVSVEFTLRATHACVDQAHAHIQDYLQRAYRHYESVIRDGNKNRYLLCLQTKPRRIFSMEDGEITVHPQNKSNGGGDQASNNGAGDTRASGDLRFLRYHLSDEKTFESLFLPQKSDLLELLRHFTEKTGKFAVPGYPHKLGLLLHGPPGTGKTSLIKAIAHLTKRHIVSIPLKRIHTNQELMELMFGCSFACRGRDLPMDLSLDQIVFVMEDVDATSDLVRRRDKDIGDHSGISPPCANAEDDQLDLAGILNVMDGVVDSPGRILIMTTNHVDCLDPALIRPGRVNMTLCLDNIRWSEALQMIGHYFDTNVMDCPLEKYPGFDTRPISPAELEQMCSLFPTAQDLLLSWQNPL